MANDEDWVAKRVKEAHKAHPPVTESVANHIIELLNGKVKDRQLSTGELQGIAKLLLADIAPPTAPKTGVSDAN